MGRWLSKTPKPRTVEMREWLKTEVGIAYKARHAAYMREWRRNHPDKRRAMSQRSYLKMRLETFEHYGGAYCRCCGEGQLVFLELDHINGGGGKHRREIDPEGKIGGNGFFWYLKKNGWPEGFQVLCRNCNWAKSHGGCPHQKDKPAE